MIIIISKINNFRQHIVMWVYSIIIVVYKIQISDQIHYHSFVVVDTDVLDFRYLLNLQLLAHNFSIVLHAIQISDESSSSLRMLTPGGQGMGFQVGSSDLTVFFLNRQQYHIGYSPRARDYNKCTIACPSWIYC